MGARQRTFPAGTETTEKRITVSVAEAGVLEADRAERGTNLSELLTDAYFGRDRELITELFRLRGEVATQTLQLRRMVAEGQVSEAAVADVLASQRTLGVEIYNAIESLRITT